ncbi:thiamine phosphate synthase [candidate division WOR-3 bacterium]|nr:thiamine phosphate synthase [candidate division WOR-3 bacterium]
MVPNRIIFPFGAYVITSNDHIRIAREACRGGARVIQYRDKNSSKQEMLKIADRIRKITKEYNSLFIVNDFIDIAHKSGADGVHLGQDDVPILSARETTPDDFIIGFSTHSLEQALTAEKEGADYIGIGPVFGTPTKEKYNPIGLSIVEEVIRSVKIPVVAIGGLDLDNIAELVKIGVQNVAMVRAFQEKTLEKVKKTNFLLKV